MNNKKCMVCNREFKTIGGLLRHVSAKHNLVSKEYYDKYFKSKNEGICPICGKETSYLTVIDGYSKHCSLKCAGNSQLVKEKRNKTKLEKYGDKNFNNYEKAKQTNLEKYGVPHVLQSPTIRQKIEETNLERYGAGNIFASKYGKAKIKETCNNRYGCDSWLSSEERKKQYKEYNFKKYGMWRTQTPEFKAKINIKFNTSNKEKELVKYLKSHFNYTILENSVSIIPPYELDIFIQELNLAIEYNGMYWHSTLFKSKNCHLNKSIICRNKGIRLIHIYEFEDFDEQLYLLNELIKGNDLYSKKDFNKNNLIIDIPQPELIYNDNYIVYGAGKLYDK